MIYAFKGSHRTYGFINYTVIEKAIGV